MTEMKPAGHIPSPYGVPLAVFEDPSELHHQFRPAGVDRMMGPDIIDISARREAIQSARWNAYATAVRRAQGTLDIRDGIAAGKAWREWLLAFTPPESHGVICTFRGRP